MNSFVLHLFSSTAGEEIRDVAGFTGRDESGSFGILPNAERRMTSLEFGLAKIRYVNGNTEYLAFPGGILYFLNNELSIASRLFLRNTDFNAITSLLENQINAEKSIVKEVKRSLHQMDQEIFKRLAQNDFGLKL